jgi:CSLREA domain-containing protein
MYTASPFRRRRNRPAHRIQARLQVEHLEDRAVPANFVVNTLADVVNPADGLTSLREAITAANADAVHDIITFAPGLSGTLTQSILGAGEDNNATGDFDILQPVSIIGPGADKLTIDAFGEDRVFDVRAAAAGQSVIFSGLKITGGNADIGAGVNSDFGIDLTLANVEVTGNEASSNGGGVLDEGGVLTVFYSSIVGNNCAVEGGGIFVFQGALNLGDSTVSGNEATSIGGGMFISKATGNLRNSTIAANTASSSGGGLFVSGSTVALTSTIVAGNTDADGFPDVFGAVQAASADDLIGDGNGLTGISAGVNRNLIGTPAHPIDPLLGPLQNNGGPTRTRALLAGSPAIDHGSNPEGFFTDQRGFSFARLVGAGVDIGAFEFVPPAVQPPPAGQPPAGAGPSAQAFSAAADFLTRFKSAGTLAAFAVGDTTGDSTADIVVAFRLKSGKLAMITFAGTDGHIAELFFAFKGPLARSSRVRVVLVNLDADPALESGLIVSGGGPGVPHISAFKPDGTRVR